MVVCIEGLAISAFHSFGAWGDIKEDRLNEWDIYLYSARFINSIITFFFTAQP